MCEQVEREEGMWVMSYKSRRSLSKKIMYRKEEKGINLKLTKISVWVLSLKAK